MCACIAFLRCLSLTLDVDYTVYWPSPGRFALQLTILTLSATTACPPFSILNETFLIRKVHTSSQKRYVSSDPCRNEAPGSALRFLIFRLGDMGAVPSRAGSFFCPYLECQARLDLLLQNIRDRTVKVRKNFHSKLRIDACVLDEVIEGVCQGSAEAVCRKRLLRVSQI